MIRFHHIPLLFLLPLLISPMVFGVFRMQDYTSLVPNAKKGMLYLFMYPRTSTCPSQAPLNMKVEAWLKLANIPFYRINNQFLGSPLHGTAPFAYYINERDEAKWIEGSDAIIDFVDELKNGKKEKTEEEIQEEKLRKEIDDKFFKILMLDRADRDKDGNGGLDWMFADEGVAAQMVPYLGIKRTVDVTIGKLVKTHYQIQMNQESWLAYFDVYNLFAYSVYFPGGKCSYDGRGHKKYVKLCVKAKMEFLKKYLEPKKKSCLPSNCHFFDMADWMKASDAIHVVVHEALKSVLKAGPLKEDGEVTNPNSSEAKLDQLLKLNLIEEGGEPFYSLYDNHQGTFDLLMVQLKPLLARLRRNDPYLYLFESGPTPADASLFSFLVQFFETPLNIPQLRGYFKPDESGHILNDDVKLLKDYVHNVGDMIGIQEVWTELIQKPWPLNYEIPNLYGSSKYEGPFKVETHDLYDLFEKEHPFGIDQNALITAPKEIQAAVEKIQKWAKKNIKKKDKKTEMEMLRTMAAYTCNLAPEYNEEQKKECANEHMGSMYMNGIAQRLTYEAIVEYNNGLVLKEILAALAKAKEVAARKDPNAVSEPKFGNEF